MSWVDDVLKKARAEVGVTEWPRGSNKVKYNTWYYGSEVSGDAYPWCMAFVQWVFAQSGHKLPYKTASCSALLNWYKAYRPDRVTDKPSPGAIVIYTFGHTGIVDAVNDNGSFYAVEGNTSATAAGSQSNGGGVFRPCRWPSAVNKFIVPFPIEVEKPKPVEPEPKPKQKGDEDMTGEEIVKKINEYTATLKLPDWAREEYNEAIEMGITDGSNPMELTPRFQTAIMCKRAVEMAKKK